MSNALAFEKDLHVDVPRRRARRWPVLLALWITVLYMFATHDLAAGQKWNSFDRAYIDALAARVDTGQSSRQVGFLLLGATGAVLLATPSKRRFRPRPALLVPLVLFGAWILASVAWSDERDFTLRRLVVFACVICAIVGFLKHHRGPDLALLALVGSLLVAVVGIVYESLNGSVVGLHGVWRFAGTLHPNHQGINSAVLILASLYFLSRTRNPWFAATLAAGVLLLLLTKSRTALIACIIAAGVFMALRLPPRQVIASLVGLAAIACLLAALSATRLVPVIDALQMGRDDSDITTLTGRTNIWSAAFDQAMAEPVRLLTGFGYQTFWSPGRTKAVSNSVQFHISEGHSAYFDVMLETGVVGAACYVGLLVGAMVVWGRNTKTAGDPTGAWCVAVLTFAAVQGLTESSMVAPNFPTFLSFAAIISAAILPLRLGTAERP